MKLSCYGSDHVKEISSKYKENLTGCHVIERLSSNMLKRFWSDTLCMSVCPKKRCLGDGVIRRNLGDLRLAEYAARLEIMTLKLPTHHHP